MYTTGDKLLNVMKEEEIGLRSLLEFPVCRREQFLTLWQGLRSQNLVLS